MIPYFGAEMIQALLDYWKYPQAHSRKLMNSQTPMKPKREALSRHTDQKTTEIALHWDKRSSISGAVRVLQMWSRADRK